MEESKIADAISVEKKIYKKLINNSIKVDSLFIDNDAHKRAFLRYIKLYANTGIKKLRTDNEQRFLKLALRDDFKYFLNLDRDQYTDDLAHIFISGALKQEKHENLAVKNTFDDHILLVTSYHTHEGTSINYYDENLELYVLLNLSATVQCKIINCVKFLEAMDADITEFGANYVHDRLQYIVKESFEYAVLKTLSANKNNYYELMANKDQIEKRFTEKLNTMIDKNVIEVSQLNIENINFTKDILEKLENIGFTNKIKREELSNEIRYEKESLDLYERKVKIHEANPKVSWNLSEAEKDKALDRYMIKSGMKKVTEKEVALEAKENKIVKHNIEDKKLVAKTNVIADLSQKPILSTLLLLIFNIIGGSFAIAYIRSYYSHVSYSYSSLRQYHFPAGLIVAILSIIVSTCIIMAKSQNLKKAHKIYKILNIFVMVALLIGTFVGAMVTKGYYGIIITALFAAELGTYIRAIK